ncbi:MAG: GIY-YIG nuclease family protein [Chloroflexi bacterium]|nr:GIY-YIG nuclease family protein [Chloroflexota bacterium]
MGQCKFLACTEAVRDDYYLCHPHYDGYKQGSISKCVDCGHFRPSEGQKKGFLSGIGRRLEHSPAWEKNDADASDWWVYILKIDGPRPFYIGQTRDFEERMMEHQEGKTKSTSGKNPKLYYFEHQLSRLAAEQREAELKDISEKNERELRRLITRFQNNSEWLARVEPAGNLRHL